MKLRSLLKSGHSVALGVLALGAVQSGLVLTMGAGGGNPPAGWTPMPDPANGGPGLPSSSSRRRRARPRLTQLPVSAMCDSHGWEMPGSSSQRGG